MADSEGTATMPRPALVRGLARCVEHVRGHPVSTALAALTLILAIVTGSVMHGPRPRMRSVVGTGLSSLTVHHNVGSLLTSVFFTNNAIELLLVLAVIVVVLGRVEQLVGPLLLLLVYVSTAVVGIAVGIGVQALGGLVPGLLTTPPGDGVVLNPSTPIIGSVLAATAFTGALWRRRIRVLGLSSLTIVLLYSGQPDDFYRLAAAFAGLLLGELLAPNGLHLTAARSSHHEARSLLGAVVAVSALGPFIAIVSPRGYGLLRPLGVLFRVVPPQTLTPGCARTEPALTCVRDLAFVRLENLGGILLSPLPLLVLLVAAIGMWHGRRVAAWAAILVHAFLALLTGVYYGVLPALLDHDQIVVPGAPEGITAQTVLAVAVPLGVAVAVAVNLRHFDVLPSRRALRLTIAAPLLAFGSAAVLYLGLGGAVRGQFSPRVTLLDLIDDFPERFVPIGFLHLRRLDFVPVGPVAHLVYDWVGPAFWVVLLITLASTSLSAGNGASYAEVGRMRTLLRRGTTGSLSYMATWPQTRGWFSADGVHAVAYRESSGVAITIGEPIGPEAGAGEAARAFVLHCDDLGLTPVFYSVRREFAKSLGPAGDGDAWPTAAIGDDTVLHPATFAMRGKRWQDVRSSINRAERAGVRAVWTDWDALPRSTRAQIQNISEEWIADRRLPELGFTIGGVDQLRDREVKLMLAIDADERVQAVTSWLPTYRDDAVWGLTLDFMRRRAGSMNGVMEFLIASVALDARERGLEFVSLSVAPLVSAADEEDGNRLERLLGVLARTLEPAYGFHSLASFKDKFQPTLVPLVIAYPDALALPAISVALARIYLPDLTLSKILRLAGTLRPEPPPTPADDRGHPSE